MKRIISVLLAAIMLLTCFTVPAEAVSNTLSEKYDKRMGQVLALYEADKKTVKAVSEQEYAVAFISVSDGKSKAVTVYSSTKKIKSTLGRVLEKAKATGIEPKWFKLDVVTEVTPIKYSEFKESNKKKVGGLMRYGIAFNDYFGRALLESQINSSGYFDHETGELDLTAINAYFKKNRKKQLNEIPSTIYTFKTQGYFSDGNSYKLINGTVNSKNRRDFAVDTEGLTELASMSSSYLADICGEDGKFIYGYYPIDNEELDGYNIIRHAGTVWNLILQYKMTEDEALIPVIDRALDYLEEYIVYKDKNTAFVNDRNMLNVGGNGIALLAYTNYAETFGSRKYNKLIEALANGVIYMQKEDGGFIHTLRKSDYSVYREYIVVFYDGEAMFGLLRAYGVLRNKKFLNAAKKSADYFIENKYEELNSHWIEYAFNELTKYAPESEYFAFGLRNVWNDYLDEVSRTGTAAHTRCETMGAAFELYDRLIRSGVECEELEEFDQKLLLKAFNVRVHYGLNYFMFPEYAMYFEDPQIVLNSFAVREDNFRIRIDDIQHFMGGYYLYYKNYDRIKYYEGQTQ